MSVVRKIAEVLSRRSRFRKRLPAEFGRRPIMVSAANQLAVYKPGQAGLDNMLLDWARNLVAPGMCVWDVGANMGLFTFPAAARGAHLVSFEPDPFNLELLYSSKAMNPDLDIQVIPAAVSNRSGIANFNISERGRSTSGLSHVEQSTQTGGVRGTYNVMTVTLDEMLEIMAPPDFIKVDAEGSEIEVIAGASRILSAVRPSWIIEIQSSNAQPIWDTMLSANYSCGDAELPGYPLQDSMNGVYNALFVPTEKLSSSGNFFSGWGSSGNKLSP